MENVRIIILITASILILFGYLRFITDEHGNINLNNYRFTGGLGLVIGGLLEGTRDLCSFDISKNGLSALAMYTGGLLFYIGFTF
ncbi:MetJ regulator of methionine regulon [Oceanicoccus sp. KOV_DT_Chl]|uniref:MetJ regulator of methionine regulon n=1 Tax=Oceanicoccus sp. KOV_DT_Chl TaxID=1904639 RepID=UPI000C7B495F|nr:MetJ regulator of methionine regulon [Oceanicoccus sp. KOV_DT_Chl]